MAKADNDNGASTPFNRAVQTQSFTRRAAEDLIRLRQLNHQPGLPLSGYPDKTLAVCLRTTEIIDRYIDRPTAEKEALKALLILSYAGTIPFNEKHLTNRYNEELAHMSLLISPDGETDDQAQLELAMNVTLREEQLKGFLEPKVYAQLCHDPMNTDAKAQLHDYIAQVDKSPALCRYAGRLVERHRALTSELFLLLNGSVLPKTDNAPKMGT